MPAAALKWNAANAGIHRARHQRGYVVRVTGVLYGTTETGPMELASYPASRSGAEKELARY